jgi:hypothetical protein
MWQLCACGYDFGPPEPETQETVPTPTWLDGMSPEEAIRSIRVRVLWSYILFAAGLTVGWLMGEDLLKIWIWMGFIAASLVRRRDPSRPPGRAPSNWLLVPILAALAIFFAAIGYLPERVAPFAFVVLATSMALVWIIDEVRLFRSPLASFSPETRKRLRVTEPAAGLTGGHLT